MGAVNRHPHAGDRGSKLRQMHNLAALVLHFHFLFGVTAFEESIDMRQNVERDRMRINLRWRLLAAPWARAGLTVRGGGSIFSSGGDLFFEFVDRALATARDSLIAGSKNAAN